MPDTPDTHPKDAPISERVKFLAGRLSVPLRPEIPGGFDPDDFIRAIERVFELQNRAQDELEAWDKELRQKARTLAEHLAETLAYELTNDMIKKKLSQAPSSVGNPSTHHNERDHINQRFQEVLAAWPEGYNGRAEKLSTNHDGYDPDDFIRAIERVFELQNRAQDELEAWESDLFKRAEVVAEREAKVALREQQHAASERLPRQQTEAPAANVIQVASGEPNEIASGQQSYDVPLAGNTKMYLWAAVVLIAVLFFINQGGDDKRTYNPCRERPTSDECDSWLIWRGGDLYDTECLGGTRC